MAAPLPPAGGPDTVHGQPIQLVEGTWGGPWAEPGSMCSKELVADGFAPDVFEGWTENVDGVPNILASGKHRDWIAGGYALGYCLDGLDYFDRRILCHSYGLNVVLYMLERVGLPIYRLVSVCSPNREDMQHVADVAVGKIGRWRHVYSHGGDKWQRIGALTAGIGALWHRPEYKWQQAHENVEVHGIGHSKILNDADRRADRRDILFSFLHAEQPAALGVGA